MGTCGSRSWVIKVDGNSKVPPTTAVTESPVIREPMLHEEWPTTVARIKEIVLGAPHLTMGLDADF